MSAVPTGAVYGGFNSTPGPNSLEVLKDDENVIQMISNAHHFSDSKISDLKLEATILNPKA